MVSRHSTSCSADRHAPVREFARPPPSPDRLARVKGASLLLHPRWYAGRAGREKYERDACVELGRADGVAVRRLLEGGPGPLPLRLRLPRGGDAGGGAADRADAPGGQLPRPGGAPAAQLPQVRLPRRGAARLGVELAGAGAAPRPADAPARL